jgi:hypothetical protein
MRPPYVLIAPATGLIGVSMEWEDDCAVLYLGKAIRAAAQILIELCEFSLSFMPIVAAVEIKLVHAKLEEGMNISQKFTCKTTDLTPVVTRTFTRKLD